MTVLQKIIEQFGGFNENLGIPAKDVIKILSDHLEREQQQIRDAWKVGKENGINDVRWDCGKKSTYEYEKTDMETDIETYINNLKTN